MRGDRRDQPEISARASEPLDLGREKILRPREFAGRKPLYQVLVIDAVEDDRRCATFRNARMVSHDQPTVILHRRFRPRPANHPKYFHADICTRGSHLASRLRSLKQKLTRICSIECAVE